MTDSPPPHTHKHPLSLLLILSLFCVFQGRHVKTGQLAAIKVMDVTGVSATHTHTLTHSLIKAARTHTHLGNERTPPGSRAVCPHQPFSLSDFLQDSHFSHFSKHRVSVLALCCMCVCVCVF